MQEQSFEKQVREKMEELSFVPSGSVWQNVEKSIHRKKEKRRVIFWAASLLLIPAGFFLWQQTTGKSGSSGETVAFVPAATVTAGTATPGKPGTVPGTATPVAIATGNGRETAGTITGGSPGGNAARTAVNGKAGGKHPDRVAATAAARPAARLTARRSAATGSTPSFPGQDGARTNIPGALSREINAPRVATLVLPEPQMRESLSRNRMKLALKVPAVEPPVVKPKKWQWGLQGSTGISGMALLKRSSGPSGSAPLMAAMPGPDYSSAPDIRKDIAFSAGLRVARSLNDRLSLTAGLRYQQFRTQMNMDQSALYNSFAGNSGGGSRVGSFGPGTIRTNYTNRYHFVELPLGVEYRLWEHLPLKGHTGVSLARMIGTNALNYQEATGIYSGDKQAFRQTQVALFADLSYPLARLGKATLVAGPMAQAGLTSLTKDKSSKRQQLYTAGIIARVEF